MTKDKDLKNNQEENEDVNVQTPEDAENNKKESQAKKEGETSEEESENQKLSEVDELKIEVAESKDKYLRLYSEFENFRRRSARERLDLVQSANQELVRELLPVLDDFERALSNVNENTDTKSIQEGMDLILNKFSKILNQKGVTEMEVKEGSDFDPEIHEAITQIPAPKEELKGKVVDVIEKGYYLHDKVVRFARVVVGS